MLDLITGVSTLLLAVACNHELSGYTISNNLSQYLSYSLRSGWLIEFLICQHITCMDANKFHCFQFLIKNVKTLPIRMHH